MPGRRAGAESNLEIIDFEMPGLHGLELLHSFKARLGRVPLVDMAGSSNAELPRLAHEHGAAAMLEKPFSRQQLLQTVETALGGGRR